MGELPDANFWLALAWQGHAAHAVAKAWWESAAAQKIFFCRVTEMALLRLLTNRAILGDDAKTQAEAWRVYEALRGSPRVEFLAETPDFNARWRAVSARDSQSTSRWSDDYLAAFAETQAVNVVTFDNDFRSYPGVKAEVLVQPAAKS